LELKSRLGQNFTFFNVHNFRGFLCYEVKGQRLETQESNQGSFLKKKYRPLEVTTFGDIVKCKKAMKWTKLVFQYNSKHGGSYLDPYP
jgi:hypothetical protein